MRLRGVQWAHQGVVHRGRDAFLGDGRHALLDCRFEQRVECRVRCWCRESSLVVGPGLEALRQRLRERAIRLEHRGGDSTGFARLQALQQRPAQLHVGGVRRIRDLVDKTLKLVLLLLGYQLAGVVTRFDEPRPEFTGLGRAWLCGDKRGMGPPAGINGFSDLGVKEAT